MRIFGQQSKINNRGRVTKVTFYFESEDNCVLSNVAKLIIPDFVITTVMKTSTQTFVIYKACMLWVFARVKRKKKVSCGSVCENITSLPSIETSTGVLQSGEERIPEKRNRERHHNNASMQQQSEMFIYQCGKLHNIGLGDYSIYEYKHSCYLHSTLPCNIFK